ncbi:hypothetical protein GGD41_006831 [Paraburkholderia bryophila]|uniref:Uncharacterized protein n=1 Tax=Paraburkholderia bryophila TaxID=420952 RepID=A0A7Y9WG44_9BURK|nr:hypothetical protein [Paraburkholderia bryophila]
MSITSLPCVRAGGDAVVGEQHVGDVRRVRHHDDDDVGGLRDGGRIRDHARRFAQIVRHRIRAVHEQRVTALDKVARHVRAHDAEADKTDLCHVSESPVLFGVPRVGAAQGSVPRASCA